VGSAIGRIDDIEVPDLGPATAKCLALGARAVGSVVVDGQGAFQVMLDPEGHEFCLVTDEPEVNPTL